MSLVTRGLGTGLLVTRGLGPHREVPPLVGEIVLRVDRHHDIVFLVDVAHWANLIVDREMDSQLPTPTSLGWTMRINRERSKDLKIGK
jgi:hypothetical protein